MSYAIPTNELTLGDIKEYKRKCVAAAIIRAKDKGIAASDQELVYRELMPSFDLGALIAAGAGWALNYYVTPAAAGAGAWASAFGLAAATDPFVPVGRIVTFYKLFDAAANPQATGARFMLGTATTKASFFFQALIDTKLEPEVWFSEPVVYDPQDQVNIDFYGRAATPAGGEELGFGAYVIERVGGTVS